MANRFRSLVASGDDEFRAELSERALSLNLAVQVIGSADELPDVLRAHDFDWLFLDVGLGAEQCTQIFDMLGKARRPRTILVGGGDIAALEAIRRQAVRSGVDAVGSVPRALSSSDLVALLGRLGTQQRDASDTGLAARQLDAIPASEVVVHYQPIVAMRERTVGHVEALVRWQHPEYGLIRPERFISLAERSGAIVPLTWTVLEKALDQHIEWREAGTLLSVSVNFSTLVLSSLKAAEDILARLQARACDPRCLTLEITETEKAPDPPTARAVLMSLREAGVGISMDDYGVGFSNLDRLRYYPFTDLKIDRGVVAALGAGPEAQRTVEMLVDLSGRETFSVTGEGIETQEQWDTLERLGCDFGQGFLISRPMRARQVVPWIDAMVQTGRYRPAPSL
jgi:EAL domain-containing protein (putative c-di-GMP-specific phosphodiesterase class I)